MPYSKVVARYPENWLRTVEALESQKSRIDLNFESPTKARAFMFKFYAFFRAVEAEARRPPVDADEGYHIRIVEASKTVRKLKVVLKGNQASIIDVSREKDPATAAVDEQLEAQLDGLGNSPLATQENVNSDADDILQNLIGKGLAK